jgi:2-polyprenyl-6-hydroxyphenyl methylase/3-demethylubiquinone-9 3-methyltransferase
VAANVDPAELAKFEGLASRWWDPDSEFKPLHDLNPIRMNYIDQQVNVAGLDVVDIGCGGGILSETLAKRGGKVLGIDMTDAPLKVAQLHALESGLTNLTYQQSTAEALAEARPGQFDVVTCMEMLEHVPDPSSVITAIAKLLKPGGTAIFSTINRNPKAWLMAIVGAEYVLSLVPKGTHEYKKLLKPSELARGARQAQLKVIGFKGTSYNPFTKDFNLTDDVSVNYMMTTKKPLSQ